MKYHPDHTVVLTRRLIDVPGTAAGGEFDWGGRLLKSNGGAQWFPHGGWQPPRACKGTRELDCKADRPRRAERRA